MKIIVLFASLVMAFPVFGREYTDPLSGISYDLPDSARTQERYIDHPEGRGYALACLLVEQDASIVVATTPGAQTLLNKSDAAVFQTIKNGLRPSVVFTHQEVRTLSGRRYFVYQSHETEEGTTNYTTMYTTVAGDYLVMICFSNRRDQGPMQGAWNQFVAKVRFP